MAGQHPEYLFRTFSDQSNGTNTQNSFAPAAASAILSIEHVERQPEDIPGFADQLYLALSGKESLPQCNTVFFTSSYLFALVLAGVMTARNESNITIVCVRVDTAKTSSGRPVKFHSVDGLIDEFEVKKRFRKSDGSAFSYAHEYAVTTRVMLGDGSCYVTYSGVFEERLHKLYPELEILQDDGRIIINFAMDLLRKYWFGKERPLSREKMALIGRLASAFVPFTTGATGSKYVRALRHIVASFAGLQKRSKHEKALNDWIAHVTPDFAFTTIEIDEEEDNDVANTKIPELTQAMRLSAGFSDIIVPILGFSGAVAVDQWRIREEKQAWRVWKREDRQAYREARGERPPRVEKRRRQPRTPARQPRSGAQRAERAPRAERTVRQPREHTQPRRDGGERRMNLDRVR